MNKSRPDSRGGHRHLACEVARDLLETEGPDDIKAIYGKHSGSDIDAERQADEAERGEILRSMIEGMFGIDLADNVDLSSPEQLEATLESIRQREEQAEQEAEECRRKRKKSPKQMEQETRRQQEEQNTSKSIQEVFRKLAAALHPDREPDPDQRARKTELMQQVNIAYGKNDLLRLLELQLEIEQIDQAHLNQIAEGRLKHFNKLLTEQLAELRQEISEIELSFKIQLHLPPFARLTPKELLERLARDTRALSKDLAALRRDLRDFQDFAMLKAWLKGYRIPRPEPTEDWLFDDLEPPYRFK